ncbi:MAG: hypothetical protein ABJQ29_09275 [Luteolibacter sp.]
MKALEKLPEKLNGSIGIFATCILTMILFFGVVAQVTSANIPVRSDGYISGTYQISKSSDPVFPIVEGREWFLDFGDGNATGNRSGEVAVSLHENPEVKTRLMTWEYFSDQDILIIREPSDETTTDIPAQTIWTVHSPASDLYLTRNNRTLILKPVGLD